MQPSSTDVINTGGVPLPPAQRHASNTLSPDSEREVRRIVQEENNILDQARRIEVSRETPLLNGTGRRRLQLGAIVIGTAAVTVGITLLVQKWRSGGDDEGG